MTGQSRCGGEEGGQHQRQGSRCGSERPHFGLSPRRNVDTLRHPPGASAFHPDVQKCRRALTSRKGATLPGLRVPGWERGWSQDSPGGHAKESLGGDPGLGGEAAGGRQPPDHQRRGEGAGSRGKLSPARSRPRGRPEPKVREAPGSGDPRLRRSGGRRGPVRTSPERPAAAAAASARPPRGAVPGCGPRSCPEWFKGPSSPSPGAPGRAAPPAGTWSPRRPSPGARAQPGTTTPEPPRPRHAGRVGGALTSGDLDAEGGGVGPQRRL